MNNFIIHDFDPGSEWVTIQVNDILNDPHYMDVKSIDLSAYENGALIQDSFPYLDKEQREIMLTGMTDEMWNDMFGSDEEE
jgi:hypothetical protein